MPTSDQSAASTFLVIGERTNITGSPKFAKALKAGDWDACLAIAKQQVESGANVIDINVDEALIEGSLRKRLRGREQIADDREFQRLFRYLIGQGFEPDRVMKTLKAYRIKR